jgi:hypothetical protein
MEVSKIQLQYCRVRQRKRKRWVQRKQGKEKGKEDEEGEEDNDCFKFFEGGKTGKKKGVLSFIFLLFCSVVARGQEKGYFYARVPFHDGIVGIKIFTMKEAKAKVYAHTVKEGMHLYIVEIENDGKITYDFNMNSFQFHLQDPIEVKYTQVHKKIEGVLLFSSPCSKQMLKEYPLDEIALFYEIIKLPPHRKGIRILVSEKCWDAVEQIALYNCLTTEGSGRWSTLIKMAKRNRKRYPQQRRIG